jgi:hypothetical protein
MRLSRHLVAVVAVSLPVLVLARCSDGGPTGTAQDFSGNYTVLSMAQGTPAGVVDVPGTTGTVTLTATHYDVTLSNPGSVNPPIPPFNITDQGTYSAIGTATSGTFTQQSTLDQSLQYTGTYSFAAGTNQLTLDTTAEGIRTVIVLQKT